MVKHLHGKQESEGSSPFLGWDVVERMRLFYNCIWMYYKPLYSALNRGRHSW